MDKSDFFFLAKKSSTQYIVAHTVFPGVSDRNLKSVRKIRLATAVLSRNQLATFLSRSFFFFFSIHREEGLKPNLVNYIAPFVFLFFVNLKNLRRRRRIVCSVKSET